MKAISQHRFHILAGYNHVEDITVTELGPCFASDDEQVLGACYQHPSTYKFGSVVLKIDDADCYHVATINSYVPNPADAEKQLSLSILDYAGKPKRTSTTTRAKLLDFFTPVVDEVKLHTSFLEVTSHQRFKSARNLMAKMMRYYQDPDGNFVEQFQTNAFDARLWELYVFAVYQTKSSEPFQKMKASRGFAGEWE